jgi:manganese-transporting P-type ATPase
MSGVCVIFIANIFFVQSLCVCCRSVCCYNYLLCVICLDAPGGQAKPLPKLSDFSPASSVFQAPVLGSILGQFVVHFACLFAVLQLCQSDHALPLPLSLSLSPTLGLEVTGAGAGEGGGEEGGSGWTQVVKPIADSRFTPDVISTAMFLLSGTISMNNFLVNYRGHPFSQNIRENKLLFRASCGVYLVIAVLVLELFEPLSDLMQLVPLPSTTFQCLLGALLLLDLLACWGVETVCQFFERRI